MVNGLIDCNVVCEDDFIVRQLNVKWRSQCQEILDVVKPWAASGLQRTLVSSAGFSDCVRGGKIAVKTDVVADLRHAEFVNLLL